MAEADAAARWGLPDWARPEEYPSPEETTDPEWRWQFLRRRHDYRALWDGTPHNKDTEHLGFRGNYRLGDLERFGLHRLIDPRHRLPAAPHSLFRHVGCMTVAHDYWEYPLRYGVWLGREGKFKEAEAVAECFVAEGQATSEAGLVNYRFDLSKPLEPQLCEARKQLAGEQVDFTDGYQLIARPRRSNWPLFLRALDARECGATYAAMAATFWPEEWRGRGSSKKTDQSARDVHKHAVQVRDYFPA